VLNSSAITTFDELELRTVLGHEAGHILSDHVMYSTALAILLTIGAGPLSRLPFFAGIPLLAIRLALLEWFRAAELSCDRAAALLTRDPQAVCRTLMVLSAGAAADDNRLALSEFGIDPKDFKAADTDGDDALDAEELRRYLGQVDPDLEMIVKLSEGDNAPATIDSDYRGEIRVPLINLAPTPFTVSRGMRIAQLVVAPVVRVSWEEVSELPPTARGRGGFGHSGA